MILLISSLILLILVFCIGTYIQDKMNKDWYSRKEHNIKKSLRTYGVELLEVSYYPDKYCFSVHTDLYEYGNQTYKTKVFRITELVKILKKLENNSIKEVIYPLFKDEYERNITKEIDGFLFNQYEVLP